MKNFRFVIIIAILYLMFPAVKGQNEIGFTCFTESDSQEIMTSAIIVENCYRIGGPTDESEFNPFIPNANSPIYTVRLNLHIMQEDDGTGNFPGNLATRILLYNMVQDINNIFYSNMQQPVCNGILTPNFIVDTRIRFRIDGIYFHKNSSICHLKPYHEASELNFPPIR